jgi:hypothetical protein
MEKHGKAWKSMEGAPREEICINPEFMRPGIIPILENFAKKLRESSYEA